MDKHDLYERCVQNPGVLVGFLRGLHAHDPRVLAEDMCGTAALSRRWVREVPDSRAYATDIDPEVLARAADASRGDDRIGLRRGDVLNAPLESPRPDIVFVGNFSIGEVSSREFLVRYLRRTHERLAPGGIVACDTYGGHSAFLVGASSRRHVTDDGLVIHYTWEQREADPLTARVVNALHFRVEKGGRVLEDHPDAFVYRWRLWSVPELRDAMLEAGFAETSVRWSLDEDPGPLGTTFFVCVVGRKPA